MTTLARAAATPRPMFDPQQSAAADPTVTATAPTTTPAPRSPLSRGALARAAVGWLLILVAALATVLYLISPILASGQQQQRTTAFALQMQQAVGAATDSFYAAPTPQRPTLGQTVAILQIPRIGLQEAVVEGADPGSTRDGPGHVAGTAGLGQPGNSVVVGRRSMYGGPFAALASLHLGDEIVADTTQGQSLYRVTSVTTTGVGESTFGPSTTDQLTLLTAGDRLPWESAKGQVVVARLVGAAFTPTPQNGRLPSGDGHQGDPEAWALVGLLLLAFAGTAALGVYLARRASRLTAFVIATPVLFGVTYLLALAVSRTLPGWI